MGIDLSEAGTEEVLLYRRFENADAGAGHCKFYEITLYKDTAGENGFNEWIVEAVYGSMIAGRKPTGWRWRHTTVYKAEDHVLTMVSTRRNHGYKEVKI